MPLVQRFPVIAILPALTACAATPSQKSAAAPKVDDAGINALYARLDQDSTRYENGLALGRAGKNDQAQAEVSAALDDLRAAATRCSEVPGCEQQRFVASFDRLLRLSTGSAATQEPEGETAGTTPEAVQEAGESSPIVAAVPELGRSVILLNGRELAEIIALNGH